ncbi:MAG: His-Xaa-Ser system protein HxsD [Proteobacteria bacterium]|nr:His-Xaa-Ser system protein HxsD [Pseudomonadota bacterium]MCP4918813.1 His-Xaa-Ser system protein HxsD [Pseudomonadota bacterium]
MQLTYELEERRVRFPIDESLFPLDAIYGAAYLFVDRCYVFLDRPADQRVEVQLRTKGDADEATLEALAGEFANELLNQALRVRVGDSTRKIREYTMAKAFFSQSQTSSIDALLAELDAEELDEDPLEIEVPWETDAGA